jgi:hypothetical protein
MKKFLILILSALCIHGCIYPFEGGLPEEAPRYLVVSGDILIGEETMITLGYVFPVGTYTSTMRSDVPRGSVTVENDKGRTYTGTRKAGGVYLIDTSEAPDDANYRLKIQLDDGRTYETPWSRVYPAPEITDLSYTVDDKVVRFLLSLDGSDDLWNFRWDYTETWEYHAWFIPDVMFVPGLPERDRENPSKIYRERYEEEDYYYCWNSRESVEPCLASSEGRSVSKIVNENFLTIQRTDERMMVLYSLLVTARGLSPEGRAYLYHQSRLSNVSGDLFQPVPSEMKGNINNADDPDEMTIGFVEVCQRSNQRIYINTAGIYKYGMDPELLLYYPEADEDGNYNFDSLYGSDAPVRVDGEFPSKTNVKWGIKRCTDCRAWGGTKRKPEGWPTSHQ